MHRLARVLNHLVSGGPQKKSESTSAYFTDNNKYPAWLVVSPEVQQALKHHRPVIALESTIISHGMPYPQNFQTAVEVEQVARQQGCVPATIAILKGRVHVGLTAEDLETLAKLGPSVRKCSRRDLALVLAEAGNGATTVAATMYIASLVGIHVFVTGGIGGVHRDVESTMDVSADLTELGRTPVAVVCAGVKSILDIPRTLEFLETQGVTVVGYGVEEFPAFFTRRSGCKAPCVLREDPAACARLIAANHHLALQSGIVIGVPVPVDQEAETSLVQAAIEQALGEAKSKGIIGRDVTPFLLDRVNQLSKGNSLKANIALIKNNCKVGAAIAVELSKLPSHVH